ncbi:site-2 protease family protein [Rhizobium deserti]
MVASGILLSILAHEAAHAWTAAKLGHRATLIRLHGGGGEAIWETDSYTRKDDGLITIAGPLAKLCLGLSCLVLYYLLLPDPTASFTPVPDRPWYSPPPSSPPAIFRALHWIAILNLVLTFVNLLPGLPLDGGHLFRHFLEVRIGPRRALFGPG